uniref:Uncharacterized protein n=1 Tax=Tetranychus urticae TaxID=32264 RepID=T1L1U3_TETUR
MGRPVRSGRDRSRSVLSTRAEFNSEQCTERHECGCRPAGMTDKTRDDFCENRTATVIKVEPGNADNGNLPPMKNELVLSSDRDAKSEKDPNLYYCTYCGDPFRGQWRKKNCIRHQKNTCASPGAPNHNCIEGVCPKSCLGKGVFKPHPDLRAGRSMPSRKKK